MLRTWLTRLFQPRQASFAAPRPPRPPQPATCALRLELLEDRLAPAVYAVTADLHVLSLTQTAAPAPRVVFVESSVSQARMLLAGLTPQTDGVLLDASGDGLREMAAFLAGRHRLTTIDVVAHGESGAVSLGALTLDEATLAGAKPGLAALAAALGAQGSLNLWSCDVAASSTGQDFVNDLATATGGNVAAASHLVGATALGGSWQLDDRVGTATAASPFMAASQARFAGVLNGWISPTGSLNTARQFATATLLNNGQILVAGGTGASGFLSSAELYNPTINTWSTTGSLSTPREFATATLLTNGQVLVAGGENASGFLSSAELFTPTTNTWSTTGSLNIPRDGATATLLNNGQILVAGGQNTIGIMASAELYNPTTNTWTTTGSLNTARESATATLLTNGQVLVAGGQGDLGALASAELYNPTTNTWSLTGSLNTPRGFTTATLLTNGQVLVAGGQNASSTLSSAELFNPTTNTWTTTGSLNTARNIATATLLTNGQVLVAGGQASNFAPLASAELFNPTTNTWTTAGSLNTPRYAATATLLSNGQIFVAGGEGSGFSSLSSTELYNPTTNTWSSTGSSLNTPRDDATATLLNNGQVLVAGGIGDLGFSNAAVASAELYNPTTSTWSITGSMSTPRDGATATLLTNGQVLVAGGEGPSGILSSAELYNPTINTWFITASLSTARDAATATLLNNGQVLVAGGFGSSEFALPSAELYNPTTNTWSNTGSLNIARGLATATLLTNGEVLVAGGRSNLGVNATLASAELFNPTTNTWSTTDSMSTTRALATATLLANGQVLVTGGQNSTGIPLASAELYNPTTNTWSITGSMSGARENATATLLTNGQVLVAGGFASTLLAGAELYNPTTNAWSVTDSLNTAREFATATLLTNGQVLVAGGAGDIGNVFHDLSSSELFRTSPTISTQDTVTFNYGVFGAAPAVAVTSADPAPIFTASNLPSWASLNAATGVLSGTPTAATTGPVAITITASNGTAPDALVTIELVVNTAPLFVTADSKFKVYGQANPTLTASFTGFVNGDNAGSLTGTLSVTTTATAGSGAGVYPLTAGGVHSSNYSVTFLSGALFVMPAPLTLMADDQTKVTGQPNPTFTASYNGFVNGDSAASLGAPSYSTTATTGSGVGTYAITPGGVAAPNYSIFFVDGRLTVAPVATTNQTIAFAPLVNPVAFGVGPITLGAVASSGLPVSFAVVSGPGFVVGNTLTVTGAGGIVVEADQPGDAHHAAAAPVQQNLVILKASDVITFDPLPLTAPGTSPITLHAVGGGSSSPLVYTVLLGPGRVSGSTLTVIGVGTILIEADQAGDANFSAASPVLQTELVETAQTITFAQPLSSVAFGVAPITLSASASSLLPISFSVISGPGTIAANKLTVTGAGSIVIEADQAGNATFAAAAPIQHTVGVNKVNQTITFNAPATAAFGATPIILVATASSRLAISFSVVSGPGTMNGNQLTTTGAGAIVISASQAGNANENPAPPVQRTLVVSRANQAINFAAFSAVTFGASPLTLGATSSSGLPVSYSVVSGPGSISGGQLTITGAGAIVIKATQAGNSNFNAAIAITRTLTVNKATLIVAANAATWTAGVANQPLAGFTISGFVNGDTQALLFGSEAAVVSCPTVNVNNPAVDTYVILITQGTLIAPANYKLTLQAGTLTVHA